MIKITRFVDLCKRDGSGDVMLLLFRVYNSLHRLMLANSWDYRYIFIFISKYPYAV